jgi:hypothetical protein
MADNYINLPVEGGGGGGGGGVTSFDGRTGAVVPLPGDYNAGMIDNTPAGNIAATNVQGAINELDTEKQAVITGGASTITTANLTALRALASDGSGKVVVSAATSGDLANISGLSSNAQTQLNNKQPLDADLTAIAALATDGLIAKTGAGTAATRTLTPGSTKLSISNGNGVSGNPTLDVVPANIDKNALGGSALTAANGGTGLSAAPANGQLPIGNGTGYTLSTLTAGAGISVQNSAGSITIVNSALSASINLDGGTASSNYGGISPIDGGGA